VTAPAHTQLKPWDTAVSAEERRGPHVLFTVAVPAEQAEAGNGLAICRRICELRGLRLVDAERVGRLGGRTWRVKAMAPAGAP
jgi:hypothetical protein